MSDLVARVLGAVAAVALVGCGGGGQADPLRLDGSPRRSDSEGIVTAVDHESLTLDGERTYDVDRDLAVFSSLDLSTVPLLFTKGQYVQVGVDGDTVRWIGTIARPLATDPPVVLYQGEIRAVDERELVFETGTVLRAAADLDVTGLAGQSVRASIDPATHEVTEVSS